jgi:hypothetical protein
MSSAHEYERFLRTAFGLKEGHPVGRGEDPAGLADNDVFDEDNLDSIKVGVGYAMEIFANNLPNPTDLSDEEWNRLGDFTTKVVNANSASAIASLIGEYWATVIETYYGIGTSA